MPVTTPSVLIGILEKELIPPYHRSGEFGRGCDGRDNAFLRFDPQATTGLSTISFNADRLSRAGALVIQASLVQ